MDEENTGASNTGARLNPDWREATGFVPVPGREIDVRPDPAGARAGMDTTALRRPERVESDWPVGHATGAFISAAASIRHEVTPYRWYDMLSPGMVFLWMVFLGAPVTAMVWAGIAIWDRLHHGG